MATATLTARHSILLSPPPAMAFPMTPSPSSSSASSTSSRTSIRTPNRSGSLGPPSHRRIRFAPLPDPRRSDDDTVLVDELDVDPVSKRHSYPFIDDESCSSSVVSDTESLPPASCTTPVAVSKPTTQQLLSHPPAIAPSWSKPKTLSLLRPFPFKKSSPTPSSSSSHSLTPTPSLDKDAAATPTGPRGTSPSWSRINFSTEEILTLGTINLFRPSSKNNGSSNSNGNGNGSTASPDTPTSAPSSSWGLGLTRWTSAGSATKVGSPLGRTQSTQSYTSSGAPTSKPTKKPKPRSNSTSASSSANPMTKSVSLPARKGTRMLNGRVYGGPKRNPDANPFANARDEDPEFVEWGYGGMGSVRGGRSAGVVGAGAAEDKERTRWERLQSDGRGVVVGSFAEGEKKGVGGVPGVSGAEEEDDGSGMGWVKKRKEAREREKREREEREKAEAADAAQPAAPLPADEATVVPPPAEEPPAAAPAEPEPAPPPAPAPAPVPVPPTLTRHSSSAPSAAPSTPSGDPEHILKTVTLPAHLHHHHRRPGSAGSISLPKGVVSPSSLKESTVVGSPSASASESESESETEEEAAVRTRVGGDEEEEDEDDDDDDDEEAAQEEARKTALGAGVEKISRHN